jgi:hypothetical protein
MCIYIYIHVTFQFWCAMWCFLRLETVAHYISVMTVIRAWLLKSNAKDFTSRKKEPSGSAYPYTHILPQTASHYILQVGYQFATVKLQMSELLH